MPKEIPRQNRIDAIYYFPITVLVFFVFFYWLLNNTGSQTSNMVVTSIIFGLLVGSGFHFLLTGRMINRYVRRVLLTDSGMNIRNIYGENNNKITRHKKDLVIDYSEIAEVHYTNASANILDIIAIQGNLGTTSNWSKGIGKNDGYGKTKYDFVIKLKTGDTYRLKQVYFSFFHFMKPAKEFNIKI